MVTCFIDLSKAHDSIHRGLAWEIFAKRGLPPKILALVRDLHQGTFCALREDHKRADAWFEVKTGFKQGDVNAPMLFNLFIDTVIRCLQPVLRQSGVRFVYKIDGQLRECKSRKHEDMAWVLMYADDIALVVTHEADLKTTINLVDQTFSEWGLEVSFKKTKVMHIGLLGEAAIQAQRGEIEAVDKFKYLGSMSCSSGSFQPELAHRLALAGHAFKKLSRLWGDQHLSTNLKLTVYKAVVMATLLYGCESWACPLAMIQPLEVFHMRCLRRLCRISLRQRLRNEQILARCKMENVESLMRFRRLKWLGHVARMDNSRLPKRLLLGNLTHEVGSVNPGRPAKNWIDCIREDLAKVQLSYNWYSAAQHRDKWRDKIQMLLVHN